MRRLSTIAAQALVLLALCGLLSVSHNFMTSSLTAPFEVVQSTLQTTQNTTIGAPMYLIPSKLFADPSQITAHMLRLQASIVPRRQIQLEHQTMLPFQPLPLCLKSNQLNQQRSWDLHISLVSPTRISSIVLNKALRPSCPAPTRLTQD